VAPLRRRAVILLAATALVWAAWLEDVYLVRCAPHWGQRELFVAYYRARRGPEEPIAAYQMNWKGENFYSGNRLPVFVTSGAPFVSWVKGERQNGTKTFWFVTEPGRIASLQSELGAPASFERITDARLNNKFALVRAVFE
jgi:hypothetical protein